MSEKTEVVNLTSFVVRVANGSKVIEFHPAPVARPFVERQSYCREVVETPQGPVPLYEDDFTEVTRLPEPKKGRVMIVNNLVAQAALAIDPDRMDLVVPTDKVGQDGQLVTWGRLTRPF